MALPVRPHSACHCIVVPVLSENDDATCIKIEILLFPQAIMLRDTKCKQYKVTGGEAIQNCEAGNVSQELNFCIR